MRCLDSARIALTRRTESEVGESSAKKTLYERKWENYNALLAATKKEQGEEHQPTAKPAAVPFLLAAPALAPRLDVPNERNTDVVLTGNDPFVSLAFSESPTLDHLPNNIRYTPHVLQHCIYRKALLCSLASKCLSCLLSSSISPRSRPLTIA